MVRSSSGNGEDFAVLDLGTADHLTAGAVIGGIAEVVGNDRQDGRHVGQVPVGQQTDFAIRQRLQVVDVHRQHP